MSALQPLLARGRYTDGEWELAVSGHCTWEVEFGNGGGADRCGEPSTPDSFNRWCTSHDDEARDDDPERYGR